MLRFGTDGVRGVAGTELTVELVTGLGRVAARGLVAPGAQVVVGRDTRRSGPLLVAALAAGLASEGVDVVDVGVLPTPGVAALCAARGAAGAVVSASHNPFADNGVKLLAPGGLKLSDDAEAAIEAELLAAAPAQPGRSGLDLGVVGSDPAAAGWYADHLVAQLGGRSLGGLRVALDCGHGAAAGLAARVFQAAGAEVVAVLGSAPDGTNINAGCGATDPGGLAATVVASEADLGLAFDGDADRVIAVAADGAVVDGDRLLALFALDLRAAGRLAGDTVVVTVMTNLGFHRAMEAAGIDVATVAVGDRNVLAELDAHGWSLGGEQSGHVVFRDLATTGDGMLSGLMLADLVVRSGVPLARAAAAVMTRMPQVLRNVRVADRQGLEAAEEVWDAVDSASAALAGRGRVLLRPSGTEKLVRVMVEAPSEQEASAVAAALVEVVEGTLGAP
ncbi:MAG TPA: phosphoglucosamine mutase [Acidimicrobiales bacterium]|nr:phosphoglucosamine mutase [Acidimicrobiales bacterium]